MNPVFNIITLFQPLPYPKFSHSLPIDRAMDSGFTYELIRLRLYTLERFNIPITISKCTTIFL